MGETKACKFYNLLTRVIFSGTVVIFGLVGNGLTMVIMAPDRNKSATILLLFYLAIVDSLVLVEYGIMAVPVPVLRSLDMDLAALRLQMNILAYLAPFGQVTNLVSVLVTVIVTWQRYLSVCKPHSAKTYGSVKKTNLLVVCSVVFSVLFHLPLFFHYEVQDDYPAPGRTAIITTRFALTDSYKVFYSVVLAYMVNYILPMMALIYMTTCLIRALSQARSKRTSNTSKSQASKEDLTLSLIIVVIIFIICQSIGPIRRILMWIYDPYRTAIQCGGPLFYFGPWVIASLLINSAVNFVIYVLFARGFRKKLKGFVRRRKVAPERQGNLTESLHQLDSFQTAE